MAQPKFTKEDEQYFIDSGHPQSDMRQLKAAFREVRLKLNDKKITRAKAIEILGRETFLSGISRAAFHATAGRESADGKYRVSFSLLHWW